MRLSGGKVAAVYDGGDQVAVAEEWRIGIRDEVILLNLRHVAGEDWIQMPWDEVLEMREGAVQRALCALCGRLATRQGSGILQEYRYCERCAREGDRPLEDPELWT